MHRLNRLTKINRATEDKRKLLYTQSFESEDLKYEILSADNLTVEVTGFNKVSDDLTIPSAVSHEGRTYTLTAIGERAFYRCYGLKV